MLKSEGSKQALQVLKKMKVNVSVSTKMFDVIKIVRLLLRQIVGVNRAAIYSKCAQVKV